MRSLRGLPGLFFIAILAGCPTMRDPGVMQQSGSGAPSTVERGRYLATSVALCTFCHSEIDWTAEGFPPKAATVGAGRSPFGPAMPWLTSPNLTPDRDTGAGAWSDAAIEDALRRGIGHDGRTLHPLMPYAEYREMADDDVQSIIKYLRSLAPVHHPLPPTRVPDEMRPTLAPLPSPGVVKSPDRSVTAAYGGYLAKVALCAECHTPKDPKGRPVPGLDFAGGLRLKGPWGDVASLNLTPDRTGVGGVSERVFIQVMKTGHLAGGERLNAIMPWGYYRNMADEDLRAIFLYLKALRPVPHAVDNERPPTPCKKCGGVHGLGSANG